MKFEPLSPHLAATVEPWFDDPETSRYLGGRDSVQRDLELIRKVPGTEFRGHRVLARHIWVVFDETNKPVGYVDVEPYDDGTAGMAFVVAPHLRRQGLGQRILQALAQQAELRDVHTLIGGLEPENTPSRICLTKAGFTIAQVPDEEGMLHVEKKLH